jgi:photosystem II stability/assembly factor-like uncharacterized protein
MSSELFLDKLVVSDVTVLEGNTYSKGNIYVSTDNHPDDYIYLQNNGSLRCNDINMPKGVLLKSMKNKPTNYNLFYNPETSELSYNKENNSIESSLSNIRLDYNNAIKNVTNEIELAGRWYKVTISSDASYQMAIQTSNGPGIYNSIDGGITWTPIENSFNTTGFYSCSMSNDGKYRAVVGYNIEDTYVSNDYGVTWSKIDVNKNWVSVSVAGNGQYMTVVSFDDDGEKGGFIYRSEDYGLSWTDVTPTIPVPGFYYGVAISQTGQYQTAVITANSTTSGVVYKSSILISSDYGLTWSFQELGDNLTGNSMSYDGKYQIAEDYGFGLYRSSDYGLTWTFIKFDASWRSSAISADGKYQIAVSQDKKNIYRSEDYGITWINTDFGYPLYGIAISANGEKLTLVSTISKIYNSNDYGLTWNDNNNSTIYKAFIGVSVSSSGQYQSSVILNDKILISSDFGVTWTKVAEEKQWTSISISLTGQYQSAVESYGLYRSSDFGKSWVKKELKLTDPVIKISGSGQYQTYVDSKGYIYVSNDYGESFKEIDILGFFGSIAMSTDGRYQTVVDQLGLEYAGGAIYVSNDYGENWEKVEVTDFKNWRSVSCSSSGQYQLAVSNYSFGYALSIDYGVTWSIRTDLDNNLRNCSVSATGQYQFITKSGGTNYYSIDYGNTWNIYDITNGYNVSDLSSTSQTQVYTKTNQILEVYVNSYVAK